MAKDLKLQKQLKHLFIYMPFQDEKPCQGQHCSKCSTFLLLFSFKMSRESKKKLKKKRKATQHKAVSTSTGNI